MSRMILIGMPGGWELMLIVGALVLLFGGSKLPQLARAIGQSKRAFKEGLEEGEADVLPERDARKLPAESTAALTGISDEELFEEARKRAQQARR